MFVLFMWYFSMLYIVVCLHHCMYVCYMFIKYQSINQSINRQLVSTRTAANRILSGRSLFFEHHHDARPRKNVDTQLCTAAAAEAAETAQKARRRATGQLGWSALVSAGHCSLAGWLFDRSLDGVARTQPSPHSLSNTVLDLRRHSTYIIVYISTAYTV